MSIKNGIKNMLIKVGIKRVKRKSSILKALLDNPENVKLEAYIENDELTIKVRKKEDEGLFL